MTSNTLYLPLTHIDYHFPHPCKSFENRSRKFKFLYHLMRMEEILQEYLCTFMMTSRCIPLKLRNVADDVVEKIRHTFYVQ